MEYVEQAHFEIIGLEDIKHSYRSCWPAIHDQVHQITRIVIKKHLREGEGFEPLPPDQYIVLLNRSVAEAAVCAENIRNSIMQIFMRDEKLASRLKMSYKMETVSAQSREQRKSVQYIRASVVESAIVPRERTEDARLRPLMLRDDDGVAILPPGIQVSFTPIVSLLDRKKACFYAYPKLEMDDDTILSGYNVLPEDADEEMVLKLDLKILERAYISMKALQPNCGGQTRMVVPVNFKTLSTPRSRERYKEAVERINKAGVGELSLLVRRMPRALFGAELKEPLSFARKLVNRVIVMRPWDRSPDGQLIKAGVTLIGLDLTTLQKVDKNMAVQKMRHFMRNAHKEKLATIAFGVDTPELAQLGMREGFGYLCGDGAKGLRIADAEAICYENPGNYEVTLN